MATCIACSNEGPFARWHGGGDAVSLYDHVPFMASTAFSFSYARILHAFAPRLYYSLLLDST